MYENRFLCGVEGVKEEGSEGGWLLGGVCDLVGSWTRVEWLEPGALPSGDRVVGVACGMVFSNSSDRSRVEKVRLASSVL
jgi:hypothetical protein